MGVVRSAWCAWCVVRNRDARRGQMEDSISEGREFAVVQIWSLRSASRQIWLLSPGTRDSMTELHVGRASGMST
jgi:hypothetical protein